MSSASISGTNMIAVFSRNEAVEVSVVLSAISSSDMTSANTPPRIAPRSAAYAEEHIDELKKL